MYRMAKFSKVSFEQYLADFKGIFQNTELTDDEIKTMYDNIKLPVRSTKGSAGYDFFMPMDMTITPGHNVFFPTGIRCNIDEGWVLTLYPKSGLGIKYGIHMLNVIPVVDSDYYYSSNEGDIMLGLSSKVEKHMNAGDKIVQGIFLPFGITEDDKAEGIRDGGFGSTGK